IVRTDVVVDARSLHLLMVVAGMRNALSVGAAIPIRRTSRCSASTHIEGATKHSQGYSVRILIEGEHLLVEGHELRRGRVLRSGDGIGPTEGQLLEHVLLEFRAGDRYRRDNGQCDPHPFAIEEEKQLVMNDRTAQAASEVIHVGSRLPVAGRSSREVIGRVEDGAVPQLVEVAMELVGP